MTSIIRDSNIQMLRQSMAGSNIDDDIVLIEQSSEAPQLEMPRRMNFILLGLCTEGAVSYHLDTLKQNIGPGDFIIVSDHHVVDDLTTSPDSKGLYIALSINFYHETICNVSDISTLFLYARNNPVLALSEQEQNTFKQYFGVLQSKIGDTSNHYRRDLVRTLLLAMFYDLSNVIYSNRLPSTGKRQLRSDAIFTDFIGLLEANCRHERRVGWYAEQMGITPKYLSESVKTVSHRTPNDWIDFYVVQELRIALKESRKTIKVIAEEMNFPNQSFLGKYFKEHVGVSPKMYRKKDI